MTLHRQTSRQEQRCPDRQQLEQLAMADPLDDHEPLLSAHLDICVRCQRSLEELAGEESWWNDVATFLPDDDDTTTTPSPPDVLLGEIRRLLAPTDHPDSLGRIGRYEIHAVVGDGSTGIVLKALEPALNRYVAVKILAPSLAHNASARRRFAREARAAATVTDDHVVPIYGVDEHQGLPYLVMRYIPGDSLAGRLAKVGTLETIEIVRIALQTARALHAAHEQGLIHRDVKPANILLEHGTERALVADFGLARVADEVALTRSGVIAGTPQFMSPEQARGERVSASSDLFSLGAVIYAMCTGHPPFRASSLFAAIKRICEDQPRPIQESNPAIPKWLENLTFRLLEKDPQQRFASAAEVGDALAAELAHLQDPVSHAKPVRPWRRVPITAKTRWLRWIAGSGAVAAVTALVVAAVSSRGAREQQTDGDHDAASIVAPVVAPVDWAEWEDLGELSAQLTRLEEAVYGVGETMSENTWDTSFTELRSRVETAEQTHGQGSF